MDAVNNFEEDSPGDRRGRLTMRLREKDKGCSVRKKKGHVRICIERICKKRLRGRTLVQNPNESRTRARWMQQTFFRFLILPQDIPGARESSRSPPRFAAALINAATRPTPRPVYFSYYGIKRKEVATLNSFCPGVSI